mmetsp:Transcript_9019/g.15696  ORF Transcript_9019/g.15696 Transcript_9019/m.15696 type:complete len:468 (-) Transcript_9019:78-1481(-)
MLCSGNFINVDHLTSFQPSFQLNQLRHTLNHDIDQMHFTFTQPFRIGNIKNACIMPIRLTILASCLQFEPLNQLEKSGQPTQLRQSNVHARPHRRAHIRRTARQVPQSRIVGKVPTPLAQLPLQLPHAIEQGGKHALNISPVAQAHDAKVILLIDPNHKVGRLGLQISHVGVEGASVGPIPPHPRGDRPFVRVVEQNVPFDEVQILIVRHGQHREVRPVGQVGTLELPRALANEALDPPPIPARHGGGKFHPVQRPCEAYSRADDVFPSRIGLAIGHEAGIVDDCRVSAKVGLAFRGDGFHATARGGLWIVGWRGRRRRCGGCGWQCDVFHKHIVFFVEQEGRIIFIRIVIGTAAFDHSVRVIVIIIIKWRYGRGTGLRRVSGGRNTRRIRTLFAKIPLHGKLGIHPFFVIVHPVIFADDWIQQVSKDRVAFGISDQYPHASRGVGAYWQGQSGANYVFDGGPVGGG